MVIQLRNGNVEFRFCRPGAKHVSLAGDFNGWNLSSLPMAPEADGWWTCQLRIAQGCYHFRYLSDDEWYMDYAAFGLDYGPYGLNSVVSVEPPPAVTGPLTLMLSRAGDRKEVHPAERRRATAAPTPRNKGSHSRGGSKTVAVGA
jgi:hypothetical protein